MGEVRMNRKESLEMVDAFAVTDVGKVRKNNEDAVLMVPDRLCYAVSDGMGGGKAGEVASAMMIREIEQSILKCSGIPAEREGSIIRSAYKVNFEIRDYAEQHDYSSMGATMVCLLFDPWHPCAGTIFHAGDSRAYRIRENQIEQLTEDHTIAAASNLTESRIAPMLRGVLTNALGTGTDFFLERTSIDVQDGDVFLLCSDGLTRMVPDSNILQLFSILRDESSESICRSLLESALDNGGRDNVSIIVVKIRKLGNEYDPSEEEAERESEAQVRNLMDLTDTPPTEVISAVDVFSNP